MKKTKEWVVTVCVGRKLASFGFPTKQAARAFQKKALQKGAKCASSPAPLKKKKK